MQRRGRGTTNFSVEKHGKYYLNQVITSAVISYVAVSWYDKTRITLCLCDLPPQNPQPQADHEEKQQTNTIRWSCHKIPDLSLKSLKPPKTRKTRETVTAKRSLRNHDN